MYFVKKVDNIFRVCTTQEPSGGVFINPDIIAFQEPVGSVWKGRSYGEAVGVAEYVNNNPKKINLTANVSPKKQKEIREKTQLSCVNISDFAIK